MEEEHQVFKSKFLLLGGSVSDFCGQTWDNTKCSKVNSYY